MAKKNYLIKAWTIGYEKFQIARIIQHFKFSFILSDIIIVAGKKCEYSSILKKSEHILRFENVLNNKK